MCVRGCVCVHWSLWLMTCRELSRLDNCIVKQTVFSQTAYESQRQGGHHEGVKGAEQEFRAERERESSMTKRGKPHNMKAKKTVATSVPVDQSCSFEF